MPFHLKIANAADRLQYKPIVNRMYLFHMMKTYSSEELYSDF